MDKGMLTLCKRHSIKISRGHVRYPTLVWYPTVQWDLQEFQCSQHSPDLRGLHQTLRSLLVPGYPT